jgi:hypothetical protein
VGNGIILSDKIEKSLDESEKNNDKDTFLTIMNDEVVEQLLLGDVVSDLI